VDLLRFVAMLPVRLAGLLGWAYRAVVDFLPKVFGRVNWSAPPWVPNAAAARAASLDARSVAARTCHAGDAGWGCRVLN